VSSTLYSHTITLVLNAAAAYRTMRLFSNIKPATESADAAISPRFPRSPLWSKSPKNASKQQWSSSPRAEPSHDLSRNSSRSESDEPSNPYSLNRVLTAQGYNSDDSDAELEKVPSRYDLTDGNDMEWDDMSNDRYSQVGKQLAIMSDDSDSIRAMWRYFDDFDEVDQQVVSEQVNPLEFDREDRDWEEHEDEGTHSLEERRDGTMRQTARSLASLTDNLEEAESSEDELSEDGSSFSSTLFTAKDQAPLVTPSLRQPPRQQPVQIEIKDQNDQRKPVTPRRVQVVEEANTVSRPSTPRNMGNLSPTPQSQVEAEIVQKIASELQLKKMTDQSNGRAKRSLRGKVKPSQENEVSNDNSRRKPPSSPLGFGLFRRNSKGSTKSPKSRHAQETPSELLSTSRSVARQTQQQRSAASAAEFSEEFEDYLKSHTTEQPIAVPTHTSAMAPRSILKTSSFTVATPTVDTGAGSTAQTSQTEMNLCDEDDAFCGLLSNLVGHEDKTVDESRYSETPTEQSQGLFAELCSEIPKNESQTAETTAGVPRTISSLKKKKTFTDKTSAEEVAAPQDPIFESRSFADEQVGNLESEHRYQLDQDEPILVTCLRDNHCSGAAMCLMCGVRRIDTLGCQQNFDFLDEALQAENPRTEPPSITGGGSVVEIASLALDDNSKRPKRTKPKKVSTGGGDAFFDQLPIRTIEIPSSVILNNDSASASFSSLGGRRKADLFVDTQLEQDMQDIQDELDGTDGKKKKTIFGRMKRASQHKQQQKRHSRGEC
jgi:hypothetical protein